MPHDRLSAEYSLPNPSEAAEQAVGELSWQKDFFQAAFGRIVAQQPALGLQLRNYTELAARDSDESDRMAAATVLTYSFLEDQTEADAQVGRLRGVLPAEASSPWSLPAEALLPIVDAKTLHTGIAEFSAQPGLIEGTYWRVVAQQPDFGSQIGRLEMTARDDTEIKHIREMTAIPYLLIEAQAEADRMKLLTADLPA